MFSLQVIDTDKFMDMPLSARLLYYELDPEYGHAFLLHVFGDEDVILKKMWKCPLPNVDYVVRCTRYMKEHSKP